MDISFEPLRGDVMTSDQLVLDVLKATVKLVEDYKPEERSEKSRIYAMVISDLQKATALFEKYVVRAK